MYNALVYTFKCGRALRSMTEATELIKHFGKYGQVVECRFQRCPDTKRYKRIGHLVFAHDADVSAFELSPTYRVPEIGMDMQLKRVQRTVDM